MHIKDKEQPTWPQFTLNGLYDFVTATPTWPTRLMHGSKEGMSWECKTPGFQWYSASQLVFPPFPWYWEFPPVEQLSSHQQEDIGHTGKLPGEMILRWSVYKIRWRWSLVRLVQVVGSSEEEYWETEQKGGSYGTADALWRFKQSDGFPLNSQRASVIKRKGSHVKEKPFQLQPLE